MTPIFRATARAPDTLGAGPPVDLYDWLAGAGADRGLSILGTLKVLVGGRDDLAVETHRVEAPMPGPEDRRLANAISEAVQGRAPRHRHHRDQWPPGADRPVARFTAADARPNLLIRGEAVFSVPTLLLRWWAPDPHDCVVIDIDGRYTQIDLPAAGGRNVDVADLSANQLREVLQGPRGVLLLDFSRLPAPSRGRALGRVLSVVAAHREQTSHPHWMMIDDAETVLSDPDIPPHVLDLSQRGHCLVMRSTHGLPDSLAASIDVIVRSDGSTQTAGAPRDHQDRMPLDGDP